MIVEVDSVPKMLDIGEPELGTILNALLYANQVIIRDEDGVRLRAFFDKRGDLAFEDAGPLHGGLGCIA